MTKKNTKKTLAMAAATAAVTGGTMAVTGNVHADTVNTQANTQTQTQNPQVSDLKTQQDASRQAYADANKANADAHQATQNAQDNLVHATAKSTEAQDTVDSAQSAVNQASNDVTAATNKANQAQTDVENAQDAQTQAQNNYDNAVKQSTTSADEQAALGQAQADAKTAEGAVTDAQSKLADATSNQSQAQSNADTATQNVKDATDRVDSDQSAVSQAENNVKNAENDVQRAQNHDQVVAQDQNNVQAKTDAKQAADAKVNDAQKINDEKNEAQSNAQTAVNDAQKTVDQLSQGVQVVNTINASDAYLNQINKERGGMGFIDQNLKPKNMSDSDYQQLVSESKKLNQSNQYQDDPAAEAIPVHMNSNGTLSDEDAKFASQYAAQLLNPLRQKAGSPVYKITNGSLKIAQDVADRYSSDRWNQWEKGHDNAGIEAVGNQWGVGVSESWSGDISFAHQKFVADNPDDILATSGTWVSEYNGLNRNDLQHGIYDAIKAMLFNDVGESFGHATDILGIRETNSSKPVEFGVSYEYDTSDHVTNFAGQKNKNAGGFHFNSEFNSSNTNPNGKFFQAEWQKEVAIPKTDDHAAQLKESITVSPEWINLVKKIQERLMSPSNTTDMDFTTEEGQEWYKLAAQLRKQNKYVSDPTQAAIPVHINSDGTLSKADQTDATQFYLSILNPIRKAIGMPELKISNQSLQMGDKIAKQYNDDNWNMYPKKIQQGDGFSYLTYDPSSTHFSQHDFNAINNNNGSGESVGILPNGLTTVYNTPNDPASGIKDFYYNRNWATNRDELHKALFNDAINSILENAHKPDHAKYVLGLHSASLNKGNNFASIQFDKYNQLHFNIESETVTDTSTEIPVETSSQTDDHAAQLASAKKALQDAQDKLETAKQEASQASADLASAKADAKTAADELKAAQDKLAHDQGSSMSLADAQAKLKNAKAVLAQKQANLADAKKNLQNANIMKSQSDSALEKANADVKDAQDAVQTAQTKAKDANAKVDAIKAKIAADNNSKALSDAEAKLNQTKQDLQVAQSKKDEADKALAKAQATLNNKQDALKKAQANAQTAAQNLKSAQNAVKKAQAHEQDTQAALKLAKAGLITDSKVYGNSVAIKDQTIHAGEINKIVDPEIANPMAKDPTQSLVMGAFLQMAASKLDTIPTGTTAKWNQPQNVSRDANLVGNHGEDVLVTFPDGSTTTVKMGLHVLAVAKPSQPHTPAINPGHETKPGDDQKPTTPGAPKDQPGHDVKPGDDNKPSSKPSTPSTEPSTTPSHEKQQPGTHTDTPTAKPSDQQPSTQPSGNQGQTKADHNVTVAPSENGSQTAVTNNNVKLVANEVGNNNTLKRSDLNNGKLPQTGNHSEAGLIGLGVASMMAMFGLISTQRREN